MSRLVILPLLMALAALPLPAASQTPQREDEIVANLAGGRVIVHVAKEDVIVFAAIDQPLEAKAVPPRLLQLDATHVGILFGTSEWQMPSDPEPVRLDRNFQSILNNTANQQYQNYPDQAARDLETIGVAFLEKLRPLVAQLHHKLDFRADDPLFEVVVIGFAPNYGPEVWQLEYRIEQQQVAARGEYWQTRILRPRFTQLYPPEGGKKAPHTLIETRYSAEISDKSKKTENNPTLVALIGGADPELYHLRSNPHFAKVMDLIDHGQAQKVPAADASDFLQAALPLISDGNKFFLGTMEEQRGFNWIIPPAEPVEKTDDKSRPPSAPSLRRKPTTP